VDDRARAPLPLSGYADVLRLNERYERPPALRPEARDETVSRLVRYFLDEEIEPPPGVAPSLSNPVESGSMRQMLSTLLTVRPPSPLPPAIHAALGAVLARELEDRGVVSSDTLPQIEPSVTVPPGTAFVLWQGDITRLRIDAIVNAAGSALLGCFRPMHACVDGAIHSAAGPKLREDCARIMALQGHREPTGRAKATRGYHLPARYVIHTVGPIAEGTVRAEHEFELAECYRACLDLAVELAGVRSLAFCAISTGGFGYPSGPAAVTAVGTAAEWVGEHPGALDRIVFTVFSDKDCAAYEAILKPV
jgi:O-acetyl-ADP-ribose deacetylase (regulator of RNase III)